VWTMAENKESAGPVWTPPEKIESLFAAAAGNKFANINAPTAGARVTQDLPSGSAPFQLYSLATPNGVKVSILLEELGIDYDAFKINIGTGEQFTSGFVDVNPNSKIPAAVDRDGPGGKTVKLFESGAILLYLADKYKRFIPEDPALRADVYAWLFWQMSSLG
jgi:GST-like protein